MVRLDRGLNRRTSGKSLGPERPSSTIDSPPPSTSAGEHQTGAPPSRPPSGLPTTPRRSARRIAVRVPGWSAGGLRRACRPGDASTTPRVPSVVPKYIRWGGSSDAAAVARRGSLGVGTAVVRRRRRASRARERAPDRVARPVMQDVDERPPSAGETDRCPRPGRPPPATAFQSPRHASAGQPRYRWASSSKSRPLDHLGEEAPSARPRPARSLVRGSCARPSNRRAPARCRRAGRS